VKIFRFYIKCTRCSSELTLKTDPEHSDYVCEAGASRNFEPWREQQRIEEEKKKKRDEEEEGDAMKALENRTTDSKREMDALDSLDEIKALNARQSRIDYESLFVNQKRKYHDMNGNELELDPDDEKYIDFIFKNKLRRIGSDEEGDSSSEGTDDDDCSTVSIDLAPISLAKPPPKPLIQFIIKPKNAAPENKKSEQLPKIITKEPNNTITVKANSEEKIQSLVDY